MEANNIRTHILILALLLVGFTGACQKKATLPGGMTVRHGAIPNPPPVVDAGDDQSIAATSTTLFGSATDPNGTITSYLWTQEAGPNTAGITSPANATTAVTGMTDGVYVFKLTATDNLGATGSATTQVTVELTPIGDTAYIILNIGQSNASGRNPVSTNYTGMWAYLADTVKIGGKYGYIRGYQADSAAFAPLKAAHNASDGYDRNQAGYQVKLMYDMVSYKSRDLYLIQSAQGGKKIVNWDDASQVIAIWTDSTIASVRSMFLAQGKYPKFIAAIWTQGESDGGNFATSWGNALRRIITKTRTQTANATLPFIIVEMIDCQTGVTNLAALQAKQEEIGAETHNYLIGKSGAGGCQDNLHMNFERMRYVSDQIFNIIKDLW